MEREVLTGGVRERKRERGESCWLGRVESPSLVLVINDTKLLMPCV